MSLRERARELLDADAGRGALKRMARALDDEPGLREAVLAEGRARGADLPDQAATWPAKRLLRRARAREAASRVRTNPIAVDEGFTCAHCGAEVPPHGRTARDHCPHCLRSLHVDEIPGDRAADCGGVLDPVSVEQVEGHWRIHYRCRRCGQHRANRALLDGEPADDWSVLTALAAAAGP